MTAGPDYAGVLARFPRLRQRYRVDGSPCWYARCPVFADDKRHNLRLWVNDSGRLCAKCYGGRCGAMSRREWFRQLVTSVGSDAGEWFPDGQDRRPRRRPVAQLKIVATYDYLDPRGRLLYQCCKFDPAQAADPTWRKCSYRRPAYDHDEPKSVRTDGVGRKWVWDGTGLDLDKLHVGEIVPAKHVLYRANELRDADPRQPVLSPEGEPDVESFRALGFTATCNPHGGGNWPDYLGAELTGRRVVLFEDNDVTGRLFVAHTSGILLGYGVASVRRVGFTEGMPEGFDASDWLHLRFGEDLGCPKESYKIPAWAGTLPAKAKAKVRADVAGLCQRACEWAILTADEQAARRSAADAEAKRLAGPKATLQEALADEERRAA